MTTTAKKKARESVKAYAKGRKKKRRRVATTASNGKIRTIRRLTGAFVDVRLSRSDIDTIMKALSKIAFAAGDGRTVRRERAALQALMQAVVAA